MTGSPPDFAKPLSQKALRQLVSELARKIDRLEQEVERLSLDNSNLRLDNQALKDEIARLKHLPPRPPFKPSGMEKATQPQPAGPGRRPGRGAKRDRVTREVTLRAEVPPGSRFKGYKTVVRRDLPPLVPRSYDLPELPWFLAGRPERTTVAVMQLGAKFMSPASRLANSPAATCS